MNFCVKTWNNFKNYQYIWQSYLILTAAPFFYWISANVIEDFQKLITWCQWHRVLKSVNMLVITYCVPKLLLCFKKRTELYNIPN